MSHNDHPDLRPLLALALATVGLLTLAVGAVWGLFWLAQHVVMSIGW